MSDYSFWDNVWSIYLALLFLLITICIVVAIWMLFFGRGGLNISSNSNDMISGNINIADKSKWYATPPQPVRSTRM